MGTKPRGTLSLAQARRALLLAQGLLEPRPTGAGRPEVLAAIDQMHALQIDTISVVARSPYLVLFSRLGTYDPAELEAALAEGDLFEHWSHAACFLGIADYPAYRRLMLEQWSTAGSGWYHARGQQWLEANTALVEAVLARIREGGPVRSADFERSDGQKGNGWWDWKEEKLALELLLTRGDLMVSRRLNFHRFYDLRERVLPGWDDSQAPPAGEAIDRLVLGAVRALGAGRADWVSAYLQSLRLGVARAGAALASLAARGELQAYAMEGSRLPVYVHPAHAARLAGLGRVAQPRTELLSPFDPVTWDRKRALELFGFDYRIECYTPAPKRVYGYFTLPILHGEALVGRLDPKAHRKAGVFEVRSLHLEPGVAVTAELAEGVRGAVRRLAEWHGTPEIVVRGDDPVGISRA
jgi:uncharacterized protein YcaQ